MRKHYLLKTMLLLCALIVGSSSAWADTWTKVTSTDQLVSGKDYLLVSQNGQKSLGTFTVGSTTNKDYYGTTDVTASSDKSSITDAKSAHVLTLGGASDEWTFYDNTDKKYVSLLIDGNYVNQSASVSSTEATEKWTISIDDAGVATITSNYKTARMLQFNSSSSRWACYKSSSSQQNGVLYVKEASSSALASIAISGSYPTTFAVGDEFSHEGMIVTATYADESTSVVTNKAEFAGYDMSTTGTQTVTVSYTEKNVTKSAEYSIKVKPVAGLAFSPASVTIAPGEETTVSLSKTTDATPSFVVADETIATYNSSTGKVVGLKEGTTTITATSAETETYAAGEAVCTITVKDPSWIDYTTKGYENAAKVTSEDGLYGNVTLAKGSGSTDPAWYDKGTAVRLYEKNTITITAKTGFVLTSVEFSVTSGSMDASYFSATVTKDGSKNKFDLSTPANSITYTTASNFRIDKVKLYIAAPVTVTAAKYATYCGTDALDFSETGIKVFTATDNVDKVKLNEITTGLVPANTPVVLYKEGADGTAINVPVIASADAVGDNDLNVSDGTAANDNMYVLANKTNGVGFYLWDNSNSNAIPEGKIYLQASSTARSFLGFEEGNTTSIDIRSKMEDVRGEVYNLNGQRVAQPTKGLYIVNGKKVVVK